MNKLKIDLVCCDETPDRYTQIVPIEVDESLIDALVIETVEQDLEAGRTRGLHNAAHQEPYGPVTYFQTVHSGGFSVSVGHPDQLTETFFGPGSLVAFSDDQGPGHGSLVGPDGVQRTMRILRGRLRPAQS